MLDRAIALAADSFKGRFDKAGKPYILHCLAVMNQMPQDDEELMAIAVLHDVVEDTKVTFNDLAQQGFSRRVITALQLLTHNHDTSYDDYVRALAGNPDLVLADEPTANLDSTTSHKIIDLMIELNMKRHVTFLFSTHDEKLMERVSRIVHIQDGAITK